MLGKDLHFTIDIDHGAIPEKLAYNAFCEYSILVDDENVK